MNIVEAVKTEGEVEMVRRKLARNAKGNTLYSDIWKIGINLALRISDLLELTYDDVAGDVLTLREGKTDKTRRIKINHKAREVIDARRQAHPHHTFLFEVESNRAKGKPVSRFAVAKAFKDVGDEVGILLGTHSMRKTLGWVMHSNGVSIERICKVLNHSSPAVTMSYIGLNQADIDSAYDEFAI